jgi:hypothetical protein
MMSASRLSVPMIFLACLGGARALVAQELSPPPLRPPGVTPEIERAIERGLKYLAAAQSREGYFSNGAYSSGSRHFRGSSKVYPTAMSSLAGLAFLASGSTPSRGPYARNIQKITDYLLSNCATNRIAPGLLADPGASEQRSMYSHAFAMTFLAQVFGQEGDLDRRERIRTVLRQAIELTARTQTDDGGWGYTPNYYEDEGTLTVTQLQGLRACRDAGIFVSRQIIDNGVRYIELSTNDNGSVRYTARGRRREPRPGVTCAAVVALWNAGRYEDDPLVRRIADYMRRNIEPQWAYGHHAEYVQYYLSQAKYVLGGREWLSFYDFSSKMLLGAQNTDGSWDGADGGDIYGTAIALIVLQLPYNRLPVYQR